MEDTHVVSSGTQLVLLGHGSPHQHNPVYERLQAVIDAAGLPIHIGVLEPSDWPTFDDVLQRLRHLPEGAADQILLAPLLIAGGRHVTHDMAGDNPDSWQSRLQRWLYGTICPAWARRVSGVPPGLRQPGPGRFAGGGTPLKNSKNAQEQIFDKRMLVLFLCIFIVYSCFGLIYALNVWLRFQ